MKKLIVSGGLAYTFADINDNTSDNQTYGLVSVPLTLSWDFSNNLLDPTRGGRTDLTTTPYVDTLGSGTKFLKNTVTQTAYIPLLSSPRLILALRGSAGSIVGASRGEVPAITRFYAGGGGSIRGIPYQKAGRAQQRQRSPGWPLAPRGVERAAPPGHREPGRGRVRRQR